MTYAIPVKYYLVKDENEDLLFKSLDKSEAETWMSHYPGWTRIEESFFIQCSTEVQSTKEREFEEELEEKCREAYLNYYHKCAADMSYDQWRTAWKQGYKAKRL